MASMNWNLMDACSSMTEYSGLRVVAMRVNQMGVKQHTRYYLERTHALASFPPCRWPRTSSCR